MNIAWSTVFLLTTLLTPGVSGAHQYIKIRSASLQTKDLRIAEAFVLTCLISVFSHLIPLIVIALFFSPAKHPLPDLNLYYALAIGDSKYVEAMDTTLWECLSCWWYLVLLYFAIANVLGWSIGVWLSVYINVRRSQTAEDKIFCQGAQGVWTVLDVYTMSDDIYSGFFHSELVGYNTGDHHLCLSLVYKQQAAHKGRDSGHVRRSPGFREIKGNSSLDEIVSRVNRYIDTLEPPELNEIDQIRSNFTDYKLTSPAEASFYYITKGIPQLIIPKSEIRNINIRYFAFRPLFEQPGMG